MLVVTPPRDLPDSVLCLKDLGLQERRSLTAILPGHGNGESRVKESLVSMRSQESQRARLRLAVRHTDLAEPLRLRETSIAGDSSMKTESSVHETVWLPPSRPPQFVTSLLAVLCGLLRHRHEIWLQVGNVVIRTCALVKKKKKGLMYSVQ